MINQRCLACDRFRDSCNGRPGGCVRYMSIDFNRTSPVPSHLRPASETRRMKFARIGNKRREQALEAIRKLEHLTSRYYRKRSGVTTYTYEWTVEQAQELLAPIETALAKLHDELLTAPLQREHGLITEERK